MSRFEITGIFQLKNKHWMPYGLNSYDKLWWRFMPGVIIRVRWPGMAMPEHFEDQYKTDMERLSSDPNDHYRPWLEQHVGRQGWDWNWGMGNADATENRLTIKIRKSKAEYATIAAMRWA